MLVVNTLADLKMACRKWEIFFYKWWQSYIDLIRVPLVSVIVMPCEKLDPLTIQEHSEKEEFDKDFMPWCHMIFEQAQFLQCK